MPEIRTEIVEHFAASNEPTPQKIGETKIVRIVSDEELEQEARNARLDELANKPNLTDGEKTELIVLLAARQGIELPKVKDI